jgi:hypothetical protein
VLGLDLAIIDDNLRFLFGEATLPVSADLIGSRPHRILRRAVDAQALAVAREDGGQRRRGFRHEPIPPPANL